MMDTDQKPAATFTAREYQVELLEKAKRHNSIILLGTGSGKTFIAAMLLKELADDVQIPYDQGGKRSFFIVGTVPLVLQQAEQLRLHTGLTVGEYYGDKSDLWQKERWMTELKEIQVFVMTAEMFSMFLGHGFFALDRANVIIFDECHKIVGGKQGHPFTVIMSRYFERKAKGVATLPRILGLTSSLINGDKDLKRGAKSAVQVLEKALDAKVITAANFAGVHRTRPQKEVVRCSDYKNGKSEVDKTYEHLAEIHFSEMVTDTSNYEATFQFVNENLKRASTVLSQLGPWCAVQAMDRLLQKFDQYYETRKDSGEECAFLVFGRTRLDMARQRLRRMMGDDENNFVAIMEKWLPSRVGQTIIILENCKKTFEDGEFSGVVFVEQRYVAYALKEALEAIAQLPNCDALRGIQVEYVVGSNGPNMSDGPAGISPFARLAKVMNDFRQKTFNLLVATNVLEEGVDVPHCNCVIHFDTPKNFTSYVQAQGRARKSQSAYFVLVGEKDFDAFCRNSSQYDSYEKELYNPVNYSDTLQFREPFDELIADQLQPPFFPELPDGGETNGRPRISMLNAIAIVNRYCSNLPSDIFTRLSTQYCVREVDIIVNGQSSRMYQGSLTLPLNSPVKCKITGRPMPNRRYARMATAFEVAKTLFEKGELDYHLMPIRIESLESYLLDEPIVDSDESILETDGRPGTKARRCYYPRKLPVALRNTQPRLRQPSYLHLINIQQTAAESGRAIPLGILSAKRIPQLPQFPAYNGSGRHQYNVKIEYINAVNALSQQELQEINQFHRFVFSEILNFSSTRFCFDPESEDCGLILVPLRIAPGVQYEIDFDFVRRVFDELSKQNAKPRESDSLLFSFKKERYSDAVITPWYGKWIGQERLFVREIRDDFSPKSIMPRSSSTFIDYFLNEYNVRVYNNEQPLLECSGRGFTIMKPNYHQVRERRREMAEERESSDAPKANVTSGENQLLNMEIPTRPLFIPELVYVHPIPASLWERITAVPFILHRLNTLLLAFEWHHLVESDAFHRSISDTDRETSPITYETDIIGLQGIDTADQDDCSKSDDTSDDEEEIDPEKSTASISRDCLSIGESENQSPDDSFSESETCSESKCLTDDVFQHSSPIIPRISPKDFQYDRDRFADHPYGPHLALISAALTLLNADDGSNLERLETVGDSFLKLAVSEYLYNVFDDFHEGKLTFLKSQLISNRNLFRLGIRRNLTDFMTANKFEPKEHWAPPAYRSIDNSDQCGHETPLNRCAFTHQLISDKSVADCVEATIGVYVLTYGRKKALQYLKWLGIGVKPRKGQDADSLWTKQPREPLLNFVDDPMNELRQLWQQAGLSDFERELGYEFKNKAYLLQALTHPSYYRNRVTDCYQPLEFLGDAVLDYLITTVLFEDKRKFSPGTLTDLRSALVNNTLFAALAVKNGFNKRLLSLCPLLTRLITQFAQIQELKQHECNFNEFLTENEGDLSEVEVPKALGDIFESIAGAIYLDSGASLNAVWSVYYPIVKEQIESCCSNPPKSPIRELMELKPGQVHFEKLDATTGADGSISVAVRIAGIEKQFLAKGNRTRLAKNTAAKKALKYLLARQRRDVRQQSP